jgi:hypothetical protein
LNTTHIMNLFFSKGPRQALVSIQHSIQRTLEYISPRGGKSAGGMSLTHLLHLSPTLKMSVILSLFHPYVFLLCMFCFLFCVFYVFVLFCLLFFPMHRFVYFFAYNFTNHSHRVETQLQLINIMSHHVPLWRKQGRLYLCPYRILLFMDSLEPEHMTSVLNLWHQSFRFNSNKSPTLCNNFSVYYPGVILQLNMFRVFSRPSSEAQ